LIVDDKEARSVAVATGVKIVGTAGVLLEAYLGAHLDLEELEAVLQDLVQVLWISPAVVAELLRLAREARI
jgi:predicted nucleic acid-binding protein